MDAPLVPPASAPQALPRAVVSWRVDANGVIVDAADGWDAFARTAGADHLLRELVVGRSLDDFVGHATTRMVYRALRERIRDVGRKVTFPFRCDAPDRRRWMTMEMHPEPGGVTLFRSWPDAVDERTPMPVAGGAADGELLLMCGWCKRVSSEGAWCEIEDAMARPPLVGPVPPPAITHGMCPECEAQMDRVIDELPAA